MTSNAILAIQRSSPFPGFSNLPSMSKIHSGFSGQPMRAALQNRTYAFSRAAFVTPKRQSKRDASDQRLFSTLTPCKSSPRAWCVHRDSRFWARSTDLNDSLTRIEWGSTVSGTFSPRLFFQGQCLHHQSRHASSESSKSASDDTSSQSRNRITSTTKVEAPTILSKINPLATSAVGGSTPKERKENIYTIPNILTASRLVAAPGIGYAILTSHPYLALGLFAYAGITDLVDGFLARRYNSQTVLGTILDPMADKLLMTTVVVALTIQGFLPLWLSTIILGRDVALAISAIYFRWISLPPPKTFTRYWDFSLPSAEVHPTEISKINTLLQLLLVGNAMVLPALPETLVQAWNLYGVFEGWQYLVASTTVWSGLSYVFNKDAVKILSEDDIKARQKEITAAAAAREKEGQKPSSSSSS